MSVNQYYVNPNKALTQRLFVLGRLFGCKVFYKEYNFAGKAVNCNYQYTRLPNYIVLNKDLGRLTFWYISPKKIVTAFGPQNCYRLQFLTNKRVRIMRNPDTSSLIRPIFSL
jgi:hypothetical protein